MHNGSACTATWDAMSQKMTTAIFIGIPLAYLHACWEMARDKPPDWKRPPGWVGYRPSSFDEFIRHPCRSPHCDANHTFPCPLPECRGYQGPVDPKDVTWWPGLGYFCPFSKTQPGPEVSCPFGRKRD